jgi:non-specific serine/threonine protein kinase/serine/threonine-protein kinase
MNPADRWQRVKQIVGSALDRPAAERDGFLDSACSGDASLRAEVLSLLAAHADADLSRHPWQDVAVAPPDSFIGPYRLLRELGTGGMGQVWLAEQTEPVRRRVALKLIRAGVRDSTLLQRFQAERQSLALMNHPAIARVFDAGATPSGQPYLVMEFVDGIPITDYCDQHKLGINERLRLFAQVCEGVQHAHQKAVIHRDLKPSNILVTEIDGKPVARIIDFGLAKASAPLVPGETLFTQIGAFLGTPGYMSPEQTEGRDIDTRTDVYSLGVVLYQLLTGYLPFDTERWKNLRLDQVLHQLRESDPERPSTKLGTNAATATEFAAARGMPVQQLAQELRGDLDWITLKALERDRERRYVTPAALAADLDNFLEHRPVEARPAGSAYRMRKYLQRHALGASVAAALILLLAAFGIMQSIQIRRITRERDRADRIAQFMINMFKVSDPTESRGNTVTAREILDKSAKGIDALKDDPVQQSQLLDVMGNVYERLGLYAEAQSLLERAVAMRRKTLGLHNRDTLLSMDGLAWLLDRQGHLPEAEKLEREVMANSTGVFSPGSQQGLIAEDHLATILADEARYPEAEQLDRNAVAAATSSLGPSHVLTLGLMTNLGGTLVLENRYAEAEALLRTVLEGERATIGVEHPNTLATMEALSTTLIKLEKYPEARQMQQETLDIQRRVYGPNHPEVAGSSYNLACLEVRLGNPEKALALLQDAVEHGLPSAAAAGMGEDPDLAPLHENPRFAAILAEAQKSSAGAGR